MVNLPDECRKCGKRDRMKGNMMCEKCHPEVDN